MLVALAAIVPLVLVIPAMMIAIVEPIMRLSARGCEHDESQQEKASPRAFDMSHSNSNFITGCQRSTGGPEIRGCESARDLP
jgi:hypothetical protein